MLREQILTRREAIVATARRHGATEIGLIGSVARAEDDDRSDIDFLVELEPGRDPFDLGAMQMDLQEMLGRPVDVAIKTGLRPRVREQVLRGLVAL